MADVAAQPVTLYGFRNLGESETMPIRRYSRNLVALCAALMVCFAAPGARATLQPPPSEGPLAQFAAHDPKSILTYGYVLWARLLDTVIEDDDKGNSGVNYGKLGVTGRNALESFVLELTGVPVSMLNRNEQLAYWLNLYNAASLRLMIDQFSSLGSSGQDLAGRNPYATERFSIKRIYTARENPWTVRNLTVEGVTLSLNDIEYRILHAQWPDEPVAYGLTCPLRGCPAPSRQPFQGGLVHKQLRDAARRFIADDDNVAVKGDTVKVSELYKQAVFGGEAKIPDHLRQYADISRKRDLGAVTRVGGYMFDWKLAGKQPPASARLPQGQMNRGAGAGGMVQE